MTSVAIRDQAILILEGKGAILDVARLVSVVIQSNQIDAAVIGGIAVVLHGYVRTTCDVDVWVSGELGEMKLPLQNAGFLFDAANREFIQHDVPVHLVSSEQAGHSPKNVVEIDGIQTVSLADLINLKLASGTSSVLRSQDIADVIGLIRANQLTGSFAPKIAKSFRKDFKKLVQAVAKGI